MWRILLIILLPGISYGVPAPGIDPRGKPVWMVGNDFHTSIVLLAKDVPYRAEISGLPGADYVAFGWGASADYRGPSRPWTEVQAMIPLPGALHVVPFRGPVTRRFPHCDVVLLRLKQASFATLIAELDHAFARDRTGRRIFLARGYFPDSRFYASRERFFFPYVCNMWVAVKLERAGVPFFLPRTILSNSLILQAREYGITLQLHHGNPEVY